MKVQGPKLAHTMHIHHNMAQDKSKVGGVHKQMNDMLYYYKVGAFFSFSLETN